MEHIAFALFWGNWLQIASRADWYININCGTVEPCHQYYARCQTRLEMQKSGWCGVVGRVSGENRGKSKARQTGSEVLEAPPLLGGD